MKKFKNWVALFLAAIAITASIAVLAGYKKITAGIPVSGDENTPAQNTEEKPNPTEPEHKLPSEIDNTNLPETEEQNKEPDAETFNPASEGAFTVLACGDNLIHERILNYANLLAGGTGSRDSFAEKGFDFLPIYKAVESYIRTANFAILNENALVGANDSAAALCGYPLFNSPGQLGKDLQSLGFDMINMANNHALDLSDSGLLASLDFWKEINMQTTGAYRSEEEFADMQNKIVEINGVKCAILSYTAGTNGLYSNSDQVYIPYFLSTKNGEQTVYSELLTQQVSECRELADCVMVLMFWGSESSFEVSETQAQTAQVLADAGADVIIGTGPKVLQKIEWLSAAEGDHKTLCAYSLGNFICTMEYMENLFGGMLSFEVKKVEEGACKIQNVIFTPTVIHYNENGTDIGVFPLDQYSEAMFEVHGSNLKKGFGKYSWYQETAKKYIPKEFLPATLR